MLGKRPYTVRTVETVNIEELIPKNAGDQAPLKVCGDHETESNCLEAFVILEVPGFCLGVPPRDSEELLSLKQKKLLEERRLLYRKVLSRAK